MVASYLVQQAKNYKSGIFTLIDPETIYINNKIKAELISMGNRGDEHLQEMRIEGNA